MGSVVKVIHGSWVYASVDNVPTILTDHDVVIVDDKIKEIVPNYKGHTDVEIDGTGKLVLPGMINLHTHCDPMQRGTTVDISVANKVNDPMDTVFLYSLFFPLGNAVGGRLTKEEMAALMKMGIMALIRGGSTTILEMSGGGYLGEAVAQYAIELGGRVYVAPTYFSLEKMPYRKDNGEIVWGEDTKDPYRGLEQNIALHKRYDGAAEGRVKVMLAPHCTDTVSPEVLRATREAADKLGCGITIHLAQSKAEMYKIRNKYNQTPVEYLNEAGVLGSDLICAHGLYTDEKDRQLLKNTETTIVHCATSFAKGGVPLPLQHFLKGGINVGVGTDSFSTDYLVELRTAALLAKNYEQDPWVASYQDMLNCATVNGAKALNRPDLGRICPGAKADIIVVNLNGLQNAPVLDPLRKAVYLSNYKDIDTVIIDGQIVIEDGHFKNVDEEEAIEAAKPAFDKCWEFAAESGLIRV